MQRLVGLFSIITPKTFCHFVIHDCQYIFHVTSLTKKISSLISFIQTTKSFGKAFSSPTINSNGDVEIHYKNGSQCMEDPKRTYESKITFRCSKNVFPGKVENGKSY
jgi:hypothetical protein